MTKKGFKSIKVSEKCHEQLKFIAEGTKTPIGQFLDQLVNEIFMNAISYPKGFNINFLTSISGSYTMVQCLGRNRILTSGSFKVLDSSQVEEFEKNLMKGGD